ncbi:MULTISPECIES: poly-gamma-glutamate biosynthesis protein PgsC/CapC [Micromonospora]|jgi:gamma-polyglutamate biosynthesis protein CapC|uniref:Capsule biosynthesis protein capC n=1 Tax=Micromonospora sicca TaxID=2202420 RepID=A0A317DAJ0_9ACTN|nr:MULTISPECIES: poly-gamma-glutamate biosynthesis protein PgsC/CapC [unclassified Micromonospora]MBM0228320.1 poly-gamma-glutamate biosynthesis protein PgsC/CapC [Micromonospora sp. ATA51]MDZ5442645.1 poly-gamma-glutamate biosynthesis protein PgsC/CapC [Micromonospora sp. 4G57]MDZ5488774.1 poly-gamma-glutamate biosynthesis protein PgsC/CapC [Micromonospora sp. 4G53]PWR11911.1 capsule biosynthesis protein capC [Micromonospora sp. 4G51]
MTFGGELSAQLATASLGIGLVFALLCYLTTNLSPGGMITPGWIALTLIEDQLQAVIVVAVTVLTYLIARVLQRVVILYGKRLFAAIVLVSVVLQLTLFVIVQRDLPLLFAHQTLGFVIPGLIAYQLVRQPPRATILATLVVTGITFGVAYSGVVAGFVPVT